MAKIRLIGDVHGKMDEYVMISHDDPMINQELGAVHSIQVGDFGAGFVQLPILASNHRFIRGNHDSPEICRNHPNWIPDGTVIPEWDMFLCGGALSIDQHRRMEGVSWWRDEELSILALDEMITKFEETKPRIMITHDCPEDIAHHLANGTKIDMPSRTRRAFQTMVEIHQPKLWVFGHWHQSFCQTINGTTFVCLDELEFRDLDI